MRTIYVVNKGNQDYSDAAHYGELKFISFGFINTFDVDKCFLDLSQALKDSQRDDYIVINSTPTLCAVACSIFARKHGTLNLLLFSHGKYRLRKISLDAYIDTIELESFEEQENE